MAPQPPRADIPKLAELPLDLTTARMKLRPVQPDDAEAIYAVAKEPSFPALMSWEAHASLEVTKAWLAATSDELVEGKGVVWALTRDGELLGTCGLIGITWQTLAWRRDRAEIGYWTAPAHQGKGYASEALIAVMRFGFEELGLHKLTIGCIAENLASKRVIEKAGFRFVARIDEDVWRNERWWSHLRYELTIGEWSDISSTLRFARPR